MSNSNSTIVITIDGPAGAGKSTIGKRLAQSLGYRYLDTGAMYRAVTWLAMQHAIDWSDVEALTRLAQQAEMDLRDAQVWIDGHDVTLAIRKQLITNQVGHIADEPRVRAELVRQQREYVAGGCYVCEGRDQGTVAFPQSPLKFYLTATPEVRARRRQKQLADDGTHVPFEELLKEQEDRDRRDRERPVGALVRPADAISLDTDTMTIDEVVAAMCEHAEQRLPPSNESADASNSVASAPRRDAATN